MSVYLEKWTIWSIFHGAHVHLPVEYFFNLQKITNFRRKHEYFQKKKTIIFIQKCHEKYTNAESWNMSQSALAIHQVGTKTSYFSQK